MRRAIDAIPGIAIASPFFMMLYADRIAQFLPAASTFDAAQHNRPVFVAGIMVLSIVAAANADRSRATGMAAKPLWVQIVIFLVLFGPAYWFAAPYMLAKAFPAVQAQLVDGEPGTINVKVLEKHHGVKRRDCDYVVIAKGDGYGGPEGSKLCEIGQVQYNSVPVGGTLTLYGHRTAFGFRYDRVSHNR